MLSIITAGNINDYYKGYERASQDIREIGLAYAQKISDLRCKCSGMNEAFSTGYTTRVQEETPA